MERNLFFLKAEAFFDLSKYKHAAIFENTEFVWEALAQIPGFINKQPLGQIEVDIPLGVTLVNPKAISIGKGTVVEAGAYIKGPCVIGENCSIRQGAYIRGDVLAGNGCVIGHDTEVKNAIFLDHAQGAHFAYVGDSILGNNVNLGAGTKCANLKFNQTDVAIFFEGKKISTGLRKLGAIIGDGCQTGCNTVLNPGTILGKNVDCYPNVNISGVVGANQMVKSSATLCFTSKSK
jgi:NDP-sugar pyrophosphorylase family protein